MVNRGRLGWVDRMICDRESWGAGGGVSLISRDGHVINGLGVRIGTTSVSEGPGEPYGGLLGGKGDTFGDTDRPGVVSQSIRLQVVNYGRT